MELSTHGEASLTRPGATAIQRTRRTLATVTCAMLVLVLVAGGLGWWAKRASFRAERLAATEAALQELELARAALFEQATFRALVERLLDREGAWRQFLERLGESATRYARSDSGQPEIEVEPPQQPTVGGGSVQQLLQALDSAVALPDAADLTAKLAQLPAAELTTSPVRLGATFRMEQGQWSVRFTARADEDAIRSWRQASFAPVDGTVSVVAAVPAKTVTPLMRDWDAALDTRGSERSLATLVKQRAFVEGELARLDAFGLAPADARPKVREAIASQERWLGVVVAASFVAPLLAVVVLAVLAWRLAALGASRRNQATGSPGTSRGRLRGHAEPSDPIEPRSASAQARPPAEGTPHAIRSLYAWTAAACVLAMGTAALPLALRAGWGMAAPVHAALSGTVAVVLLLVAVAATWAALTTAGAALRADRREA